VLCLKRSCFVNDDYNDDDDDDYEEAISFEKEQTVVHHSILGMNMAVIHALTFFLTMLNIQLKLKLYVG
jgi:hypothetical protein